MVPITPIDIRVPIVDEKGRPTPQFQRQWQAVLDAIKAIDARLVAGGL